MNIVIRREHEADAPVMHALLKRAFDYAVRSNHDVHRLDCLVDRLRTGARTY